MSSLILCPGCDGTGQKDKVWRGNFAPGDCEPCLSSGWVDPDTKRRPALRQKEGKA